MRKLFLGMALAAAAAAVNAGVVAQVTVTCGTPSGKWGHSWGLPTVNVTYSTGTDAGTPGLFWLGILTPDQQFATALDLNGEWIQYEGGLYPPHKRYDGGLPGTVSISVPLPGGVTNTAPFVGHTLYAGHGAYTQQSAQMVNKRRTYLNTIKPERQAKGKWQSAYDDDTLFMWSLVQRDMTDKEKWGPVLTIPFIECTQDTGGG